MARVHRHLDLLRKQAEHSNCKVPMAALVLRGNKVVALGNNKKGHRASSLHAEMDALRQLRYQKRGAKGATVFVARFRHDGSFGNAKPCLNCLEHLSSHGVKDVMWTTARGTIEWQFLDQIETDYLPPMHEHPL